MPAAPHVSKVVHPDSSSELPLSPRHSNLCLHSKLQTQPQRPPPAVAGMGLTVQLRRPFIFMQIKISRLRDPKNTKPGQLETQINLKLGFVLASICTDELII